MKPHVVGSSNPEVRGQMRLNCSSSISEGTHEMRGIILIIKYEYSSSLNLYV